MWYIEGELYRQFLLFFESKFDSSKLEFETLSTGDEGLSMIVMLAKFCMFSLLDTTSGSS